MGQAPSRKQVPASDSRSCSATQRECTYCAGDPGQLREGQLTIPQCCTVHDISCQLAVSLTISQSREPACQPAGQPTCQPAGQPTCQPACQPVPRACLSAYLSACL